MNGHPERGNQESLKEDAEAIPKSELSEELEDCVNGVTNTKAIT